MDKEQRAAEALTLFIAGGLLGAGMALLLAPQSGKKTRREIRHMGRRVKHKAGELRLELGHSLDRLVDDVYEKVQDGINEGREWTDRKVSSVLQTLDTGRQHITAEIDKITRSRD